MNSKAKERVLHVITALEGGGAEAVLYRLVTSDTENTHHVISLATRGKYAELLEEAGIGVEVLGMRRNRPSPFKFMRLVKLIRAHSPSIVQTWMYHADLFGGIAARLAGVERVFWGMHNSTLDPDASGKGTFAVMRINRMLSSFVPTKIVSCSQTAAKVHVEFGYCASKILIVPNGYDLSEYSPDPGARKSIRNEFGLANDALIFGMVARYNPLKDHKNLIAALSLLKRRGIKFGLFLVGQNMTGKNLVLLEKLKEYDLLECTVLAGRRSDIPAIMNSIDIHILSSYSEAFPNVLCEAMLCGTICVTTDVGDSAYIVGDTGRQCPPNDSELLSMAIENAIPLLDDALSSSRARGRIVENFSLEAMVDGYRSVWNGLQRGIVAK